MLTAWYECTQISPGSMQSKNQIKPELQFPSLFKSRMFSEHCSHTIPKGNIFNHEKVKCRLQHFTTKMGWQLQNSPPVHNAQVVMGAHQKGGAVDNVRREL